MFKANAKNYKKQASFNYWRFNYERGIGNIALAKYYYIQSQIFYAYAEMELEEAKKYKGIPWDDQKSRVKKLKSNNSFI